MAPATEQSGVGHSITYLTPLIVKEMFRDRRTGRRSAAGLGRRRQPGRLRQNRRHQVLPRKPDLVVSGINSGLNAGINVLYSGTVAAAIEGAFFGITSMAVSLEYSENPRIDKAARLAARSSPRSSKKDPEPQLYNLNIPTAALSRAAKVCVVPMNVTRYGDAFQKRKDPWGRDYYWLTGGPAPLVVPGTRPTFPRWPRAWSR